MNEQLSNVFIIGAPRSGTSALSWAMAQHPRLWTCPESVILLRLLRTPWLKQQYDETLNTHAEGTWLKKLDISYEEYAAAIGSGLDRLWSSRAEGRLWVDATPAYTTIVPELMVYFPRARFIHILRDGRAVVNSALLTGFPYQQFKSFQAACRMWDAYVNLGLRAAREHPQRVLEVRHESLTADPEAEFARIYAFLGLEPCQASADFIQTKRINSSYLNERAEDLKNKIKDPASMPKEPWSAWPPRQRRLFERTCGATMRDLGYALDEPQKNPA